MPKGTSFVGWATLTKIVLLLRTSQKRGKRSVGTGGAPRRRQDGAGASSRLAANQTSRPRAALGESAAAGHEQTPGESLLGKDSRSGVLLPSVRILALAKGVLPDGRGVPVPAASRSRQRGHRVLIPCTVQWLLAAST